MGAISMSVPSHVDYVIVGAGIHGVSTAWRLAERLIENGEEVEGRIVILDKSGIASGASGIACGVVRNNYFQPAMRRLMAHSVGIWETDPEGLSYHPVGYMQIQPRIDARRCRNDLRPAAGNRVRQRLHRGSECQHVIHARHFR